MSVVAVKVESDKITIASDSIIIKDDLKRTNFQKLHDFGHMIVGGCGSAEELSLFFEFAKRSKEKLTSVYAVQEFMSKFANCKRAYTDDNKIINAYIIRRCYRTNPLNIKLVNPCKLTYNSSDLYKLISIIIAMLN